MKQPGDWSARGFVCSSFISVRSPRCCGRTPDRRLRRPHGRVRPDSMRVRQAATRSAFGRLRRQASIITSRSSAARAVRSMRRPPIRACRPRRSTSNRCHAARTSRRPIRRPGRPKHSPSRQTFLASRGCKWPVSVGQNSRKSPITPPGCRRPVTSRYTASTGIQVSSPATDPTRS